MVDILNWFDSKSERILDALCLSFVKTHPVVDIYHQVNTVHQFIKIFR